MSRRASFRKSILLMWLIAASILGADVALADEPPPAPLAGFEAVARDNGIHLSFIAPPRYASESQAYVRIPRSAVGYPEYPNDFWGMPPGTILGDWYPYNKLVTEDSGSRADFVDPIFVPGVRYYYSAFVMGEYGGWSDVRPASVVAPLPVPLAGFAVEPGSKGVKVSYTAPPGDV